MIKNLVRSLIQKKDITTIVLSTIIIVIPTLAIFFYSVINRSWILAFSDLCLFIVMVSILSDCVD